jgi:hypothetical protein
MNQPILPAVVNAAVPEIYADGATSIAIRRNVARITLVSDRASASAKQPIERVVVGHVAMSVAGFVSLYLRMASVVEQMRAAGLIKTGAGKPQAKAAPMPAPPRPPAKPSPGKKAGRRK